MHATIKFIITAAAVASIITAQAKEANLVRLTDPRARCMDGTLSGFYFQANATERGGDKWVIHLQGGGECDTAEDCYAKLDSNLGSSDYFDASLQMPFLCVDDTVNNPDLWDFNHVYIPYCTGDLHSGTVEKPDESTFGLYFSGHLVFAAVIQELMNSYGLAEATDVILSGDSAGGIGAWINVDYLAEILTTERLRCQREPVEMNNQSSIPAEAPVRVVVAPIAGFYFYVTQPYYGPDHTSSLLTDFSASGIEHAYGAWQSFVDNDCEAGRSEDPWACLLSNYSLPYIQSDAFVIEAQTDEVVLENHDWVPPAPHLCDEPETIYVHKWSLQMRQALQPLLDNQDGRYGVFSPACYIHTDFSPSSPIINGSNYLQAFSHWYFGNGSDAERGNGWDHCGPKLYCNPTCYNPCS